MRPLRLARGRGLRPKSFPLTSGASPGGRGGGVLETGHLQLASPATFRGLRGRGRGFVSFEKIGREGVDEKRGAGYKTLDENVPRN